MKQYEITGLGPTNPDGNLKIFTRLYAPFIVNAAWLAEQTKAPAVGDFLEVSDAGALTLVTTAQGEGDAAAEKPDAAGAPETQKKSLGSADSGAGSELALFKRYQGKPVVVEAAEITEVGELNSDGSMWVWFEDGSEKLATPEMLSRISPAVGDYWVVAAQADGDYEYLNPKAVFEAKYEPYAPLIFASGEIRE